MWFQANSEETANQCNVRPCLEFLNYFLSSLKPAVKLIATVNTVKPENHVNWFCGITAGKVGVTNPIMGK